MNPLNQKIGKIIVILEIPAKRFQNLLVADFKSRVESEMRAK